MSEDNNFGGVRENKKSLPPKPPMIFKKMVDVMKDIGAVGKDQKNQHQGFKFRGIDQFVNALHPALAKNNVFLVPRVMDKKEELKEVTRSNGKAGVDKHVSLTMSYTFYAEDGSNVTVATAGEGVDSGDKATNKAMSAALKYALIQTFSVPTEDMVDGDATSEKLGTTKKANKTQKKETKPSNGAGFKKPVKNKTQTDDVWS